MKKAILGGLAVLALGAGCATLKSGAITAAKDIGWGDLEITAYHKDLPECIKVGYYDGVKVRGNDGVKVRGVDHWNGSVDVEGVFCCVGLYANNGDFDKYKCKLLEYKVLIK